MLSDETDPLHAKLDKAEHRLQAALGEVCDDTSITGVRKPNTGDLIRIDETLALAGEAAKRAISLRRQRRSKKKKGPADNEAQPSEQTK
jgi:hypothetical protein